MKGKILQKFIAMVLVFCMTAANFILVATDAVYAISTRATEIKNTGITFDAYFKSEDKKTYDKTASITSGDKLYVSIDMKTGVLENAKIKINNANFKILKDEVKNSYVKYINDDTNEIELNKITYGNSIEIELPIKFEKSGEIATDYFSMENEIALFGTYKNSSEENINGVVNTKLTWNESVVTNYPAPSIEKIIINKDKNKILVQEKVVSEVENNVLPKTEETIKVKASQIDGKMPSKVYVLENGTKLSDELILNKYNATKGSLEFTVNFVKDNKITWNNGKDEYTLIFIYEQEIPENISIKPEIEINTKVFGHDEKIFKGKPSASYEGTAKQKGNIVSVNATSGSEDVYKGYMYSGTEETLYNENYEIEISDKDDADSINLEFEEDNFKTQSGEEKSTNKSTVYKQIKINKENMKEILGTEGKITIEDVKGNTYTIDNNNTIDEEGNIVQALDTNGLKITTTKPQQEGTLKISANKAIKGNAGYSREEIEQIDSIETKIKVYTDETNSSEATTKKEIKDTKTEAYLSMNNENKGNIISAVSSNKIEFIATLKTGTMDTDLYKEPTIKIELPQEVSKLDISSVSALYAGNEIEVESYKEIISENGNKTIYVKLKGEQINYDNKVAEGIKVTINTNITLDELSTSKASKIKMIYTNENGAQKEYSTDIDVNIVSREGIILRNTLIVEEDGKQVAGKKTLNDEVLTQNLSVNNKEKLLHSNMVMVNNYDTSVENVSIIGKLPVKDANEKIFETSLTNTFDANLKSAIKVSGKDAKILYSEDENAKADSESWTEDINNAKSFKIVLQDNKLDVGEKVDISYDIEMPANLSYNQTAYTKLEMNYDYEGQTQTKKAANLVYTELKSSEDIEKDANGTNQNIEGLNVKIVAISAGKELNNNEAVYEGQTVKYIITLTNNTGKDLNNLKIEANHENANVFDEEVYEEPDTFNTEQMKKFIYIVEKEGKSNKEIELGTVKNSETKTVNYQIRVKENVTNVKGNIKILADELKQGNIELNNDVKDAGLKLTITNNISTDNSIIKGNLAANKITVKNISDKDYKDIYVTLNTSKLMSVYNIEESEKYEVIDKTDEFVKLKVKQLNKGDKIDISIILMANSDKDENVNLQGYATVDGATYFSNEVEISLKNDIVSNLEVLQEGSIKNDYVKNGDNLIYITTIKNNANSNINILTIEDKLPNVLTINKAYIEKQGSTENIENIENNQILKTLIDIKPNEEVKLYVDTSIDTTKAGSDSFANSVKIEADQKEYESNEITYKLSDYNDESRDEINDGEKIDDNKKDEDNGNGDENKNDGSNGNVTYKNAISGCVWKDTNKNGIRESSEEFISGIKVMIANVETGKYLTDKNGNKLEVVTDENGVYKFENIDSGKYMIVFEYDNVKYRNTEYHANKATESTNSDVITSKVSINNDTKKYAVTDTLELTDKELENIDAGFIENEVFDLNLNKYVSRITVQNKAGTTVKEYNKEQLAKLEIDSKQLAGSTVLIEYEIRITNEGELPGYANEIVDYIPTDLKFSSEINKDWYISTDGNLHNTSLTNDVIDVGETKILTLTLTKTMTENNTGTTVNTAEIAKASNELSIPDKDSTPGNKVQGEDDMSTAEVIISIRTGLAFTIGTIVVIIILAVGGTVIYTIKRKEANHEN